MVVTQCKTLANCSIFPLELLKQLYDVMGIQQCRNRPQHPKNLRELEIFLKQEWQQIPLKTCLNLIDSMPRRIEECIANNGWPTRY